MKIHRRVRQWRSEAEPGLTRAERTAEVRRARALSHLRRVRGQAPGSAPRRTGWIAAAAVSVAAGAAAGLALAEGAGWPGDEARVEAIAVRGTRHLGAAEVAAATGVARGLPLAAVAPASVEKRLEDHAWIARARALRLPTGILLVDVTERIPVAWLRSGEESRSWGVDASGTPFAVVEPLPDDTLPRIRIEGAVVEREPDPEIAAAVQLLTDLPRHGLTRPVEVSVSAASDPTGFALRFAGLRTRIVLGRRDLDSKLREIARLLAADAPEIGAAAEIDLRFAGQAVLRNEPPPEGAAQAVAARGRATPPI